LTRRLVIESRSNERLKAVRRLARKRARDVCIAEGGRALRCALAAGADIREVYAAPSLFRSDDDVDAVARAETLGVPVFELAHEAFLSISGAVRADGLLAIVARPATSLARLTLPAAPLVLVAESIDRAGNLGTIARTACAAGADALLVCDARTDLFHPDVIRGSVGTIFGLPTAACATTHAIAWLRERNVSIVVATPDAARPYWAADLCGALVVGNERCGVSAAWRAAADELVSIPMPGPADSLNVAVAAGVLVFEAARSRPFRT
jgi:TrmH family RNA methyltransferase